MRAEPDAQSESFATPGVSRLLPHITMALLALIALLAGLTLMQLRALTIEQKRATCYARLAFLPDPFEDHPQHDTLLSGAARHCEGNDPLVESDKADQE